MNVSLKYPCKVNRKDIIPNCQLSLTSKLKSSSLVLLPLPSKQLPPTTLNFLGK